MMSNTSTYQPSIANRSWSAAPSWRLQRKCACGAHAGGGECAECASKRVQRQAATTSVATPSTASVDAVVASSGHPLPGATRQSMEAGFGHDFSQVRVHDDAVAAHSAAALDAAAYTVGSHVVFAGGQYAPDTSSGSHLLAHELAHVVQQRSGSVGSTTGEDAHLEHEADQAALRIHAGEQVGVASQGPRGVMRQQAGRGTNPPAPRPRAPNATEQRVIEKARAAAAVRIQLAHFKTAGLGPSPPDRRDDLAGIERKQQATQLATRMFDWDPPNMDQVDEIVGKMISVLAPGADIKVAGAGDPDCGTRSGYVAGHRVPIVLCPHFFTEGAEEQVRTMMHESAHVVGIGKADLGESYCVVFDCQHGCGGFDSADSWAQYVHCLSGAKADKPTAVTGRPPPTGGGTGGGGRP